MGFLFEVKMANKNFNDTTLKQPETKDDEDKVLKLDLGTGIVESNAVENIYDQDYLNVIDLSKKMASDGKRTKEEELLDLVYDDITKSISASAGMRNKLRKYEMIANCEPDPKNNNMYWSGSSNVRSPLGAKILEGKFCRWITSMFGVNPICLIDILDYDGKKKDKDGNIVNSREERSNRATAVEAYFHYIFTRIIKGVDTYRDILTNTGTHNTGLALLWFDCEYKKKQLHNVSYKQTIEFKSDFKDAKEAGIPEEEYNSLIAKLDAGEEVVIPKITKLEKAKEIPKLESINRDDFIILPDNAKNLEIARGHGYKFELSWDGLKKGEAEKRYKNVDKLKNNFKPSDTGEVNQQKNLNEGKDGEDTEEYRKRMHNVYKLIYKYQVDDEGIADTLILTFSYDCKQFIRTEVWDENLYIIPHRIRKKPGRFDGIGTIKMVEPMNDQTDTIYNLRNNAAKIVCSPSFKAKNNTSFDPYEQEWMPGAIFWLDNMGDVDQFQVTNNFPELFQEEVLQDRYAQEKTGITSASGGRESPNDPNAPGNKTIALIQEGNIITNEDIACLRTSVEEVFYYILQMCAKYLPDNDKYLKKFGLTKEDLKISLEEVSLHGIDITFNKEVRKQQEMLFYNIYGQDPIIRENLNSATDMLKSGFRAWGRDKLELLPTTEEVKEIQIQIQMEAMRRLERENIAKMEEQNVAESQRQVDKGVKPPPPPPPPAELIEE